MRINAYVEKKQPPFSQFFMLYLRPLRIVITHSGE